MFTQVFQQAWQISATKAMRDRDRGKFYESVFKGYSICVFVAASLAIGAAGLLARFLLLGDFYAAKSFIPLLMIGALFNGLSSYLGAFYAAFKESGKLLFSTAVGGALNVVVSIALTWQLGAWGSAVGFALSNFAICVIRLRGSREHVGAGAREGWFWGGILIVSVQTCLATLDVTRDTLLPCVMIVVLVVFEALANKTALLAAIGKALGRKRA